MQSASTKSSPSEINYEITRVSKEILKMEPSMQFPVNLCDTTTDLASPTTIVGTGTNDGTR